MSKPDYTTYRGDTIDVAIEFPGADLTGAALLATLKLKLDDATNDDAAVWKQDYDCDNTDVCDDPTTGIAYIQVPAASAYNLLPKKIYTLDVQANMADGAVKTLQARIEVDRDGTRRAS